MSELRKMKEDETREQYINYIYTNKVSNSMTNKECADIINTEFGTNFQESYLRGIFTNYSKGYNDGFEQGLLDNGGKNKLREIESELGELFVTKQEVRNKTNKLNRIKRDFVKSIEIANDIKEYLEDLDLDLIEYDKRFEVSDNKLIIQISDIHIGYTINDYKGNTYNYQVAKERLSKLIMEANKMCDMYGITEVVIVNTGDLIENTYMRETSQAFECEFNMSQQIAKGIELLYDFCSTVSTFANVKLISLGGNHSRLAMKNSNIEGDNSNVVIVESLKMLFKGNECIEVIEIDYADDSCYFDVNGVKFLAIHGDNRVADSKKLYDSESVDVILRGHWHNFNVTSQNNGGYVITCGCLFGSNPYSVKRMACDTKASQTLIVVSDEIEVIKNVILN